MIKIFYKSILCFLFILVLCLIPSTSLPDVSINVKHMDKVVHFIMYFAFTLIIVTDLISQNRFNISTKKVLIMTFFLMFFIGVIIELLQLTIAANRSGEIKDVIANVSGIVFGLLLFKPGVYFITAIEKLYLTLFKRIFRLT